MDDFTLAAMYENGLSTYVIARETSVPKSTVLKRLRHMGVNLRNLSDRVRKYRFNHGFFSEFSPQPCYWAGLLAADGNVSRHRHPKIRLGLKTEDEPHLVKFAKALEYDGRIYRQPSYSVIVLSSDRMADDLSNKFGIVPNKSLVIRPPTLLSDAMVTHFVRGYIDGDGSFVRTRPQLNIVGTKEMMLWMRDVLADVGGGNPSVCQRGKIFSVVFGGGSQVAKIVAWLYAESSEAIRLDRKFMIAHKHFMTGTVHNQHK